MSGLIAIVGRPNVGKSALFNRIVGRRKLERRVSPCRRGDSKLLFDHVGLEQFSTTATPAPPEFSFFRLR